MSGFEGFSVNDIHTEVEYKIIHDSDHKKLRGQHVHDPILD
jgi:hypothetical protein